MFKLTDGEITEACFLEMGNTLIDKRNMVLYMFHTQNGKSFYLGNLRKCYFLKLIFFKFLLELAGIDSLLRKRDRSLKILCNQ